MQKECAICGVLFDTDNANRKYCDKCRDNPEKNKRDVERAYRESYARMYDPEVITIKCDECGIEFKTIRKLRITENIGDQKYVFCKPKCKNAFVERYEREHAKCLNCGKHHERWPSNYCSDECKKEHKRKIAIRNGYLHICEYCGSEFYRPVTVAYFCGNDCCRKARKAGWKNKNRKEEPKDIVLTWNGTCSACHKNYTILVMKDNIPDPLKPNYCPDCKDKQKQTEQIKRPKKITVGKPKTEKKATEKKEEQLCGTCKTSYIDCERMSSGFRILPKGAKYNNRGMLVVCPKYTDGRKKC